MQKILTLLFGLFIFSTSLTAQFDTIAGPFPLVFDMTASEDFVFAAVADFNAAEIRAYDGLVLNDPGRVIYTNTLQLSNPIISLYYDQNSLYFCSSGPTIQTGSIRRITNLKSNTPDVELITDLPWAPTQVAVKDDILFIARFSFFGGDIFTYDMNAQDPQPERWLTTGTDALADFKIAGDHLLVINASEEVVFSVDLNQSRPRSEDIIKDLDSPGGLTIDQDQLYVVTNNRNNNATARVGVYDYDPDKRPDLVAEEADNTRLTLRAVERLDGQTYVLENVEGDGRSDDISYLLRIPNSLTSQYEPLNKSNITIYPNPASNYVEFTGEVPRQVDVMSTNGKLVKSVNLVTNQVDISEMASGMYLLMFRLEDGTYQRSKFIKQ